MPCLPDAVLDEITCGFALRNVADLAQLFTELARVVRRGRRIALSEVAEPEHRLARPLHRAYFRREVPLIGAALSDREAYGGPATVNGVPATGP